ncbi:fungal-specific transcription factor domain-containing protein [Cadophora sp. MPI-SDFR-AT-0126]|nr:fungal-specific transcription factor domain-containing protein [Leotiomycetes sp. MPI-SDFR-AT-0126]
MRVQYEVMRPFRINKSCDQCRDRKVRCNVQAAIPGQMVSCTHCKKRNENCHFSTTRRNYRPGTDATSPAGSSRVQEKPAEHFIDRLLRNGSEQAVFDDEFSIMKVHDQRSATSSSLAVFSEQRLNALTDRLGNPRLKVLVNGLDDALRVHLKRGSDVLSFQRPARPENQLNVSLKEKELYVSRYFDHVQPIYPFLDRGDFEASAFRPDVAELIASNPSFSALYHTVLALGCLYQGGGGYAAGVGTSWGLFTEARRHLSDILIGTESLQSLQALVAMSVFSMTPCCLQVNHPLLTQAARMVLALRYHKSSIPEGTGDLCQRIFWVIYHLDKQYNFQARSSSIIADYDICCPIPVVAESVFENYDWFRASIGFCRILSVAYETVFSVNAMTTSTNVQLAAIDRVHGLLEDWRSSIPIEFRPREARAHGAPIFANPGSRYLVVQTHYYYYHLVIALERLTLHLDREGSRQDGKRHLMNAARGVIELVKFIDVEPYTSIFIQAIMPLSALLILFDFIVHNPRHSETSSNLILLDVVSGHFSLLDLASNGSLPGSHLSEFARIARQYINDLPEHHPSHTEAIAITSSNSFGDIPVTSTRPPQPIIRDEIMEIPEGSEITDTLYYPVSNEDLGNFDSQYIDGSEFWPLFGSYAPY